MTLFWTIAVVMIVVALALVVPPLCGRRLRSSADPAKSMNLARHREQLLELSNALEGGEITQQAFNDARDVIANALLVELSVSTTTTDTAAPVGKTPGIVIAALIPIASVVLYLWLGSTASLSPQAQVVSAKEDAPSVEAMVTGLAAKLRDQPNDPQGWLMLARSYSVMERYPEARDAYERAHALTGDQAAVMVDYAEAIALAESNRLTGKPTELLNTALALEPDNPKGLWLAGFAARQNGNDEQAATLWRKLAGQLAPDSRELVMVEEMLAEVLGAQDSEPARAPTPVITTAAIEVRVSLAPALASRVTGDETLFIFARAVAGPPMPLAIQRRSASELPLLITLDDSMHMLPAFKLSTFPTVSVGARISRSGNASASAGDLQGLVSPVEIADQEVVNLVITEIVE